MKKLKSKTMAILIAVLLTFSTIMLAIPQSAASVPPTTTPTPGPFPAATPSKWITIVTTTPNGAYRPTPGTTIYPFTESIGYNPERTGYTPGPADLTNHVLWCANIPTVDWNEFLVANGSVYIVNLDQDCVMAVNANTGQTVWQFNLPTNTNRSTDYGIIGGPWDQDNFFDIAYNQMFAAYGNTEYTMIIGTQQGTLECVNMTGREALLCPPGTVFPKDYAVYTITQYNAPYNITCWDLSYNEQISLTEVWNATNPGITSGERLSYYNDAIYGGIDGKTWTDCVNASTGALLWNYTEPSPSPDDIFYQHPVLANDYAYYPLEDNKLLCLNATTGAYLWEFVTNGTYVNYASTANGLVYLQGGAESKLYCVNGTTGKLVWAFKAQGPLEYYSPVIAEGFVYTTGAAAPYVGFPMPGTYQGEMYCINATTGDLVWKFLLPHDATFWALADGNLYAASPFGQFWCWGPGPTTTTLTASTLDTTVGNAVVVSGSVTDESPYSQQNPTLQSPDVSGVPVILSYVASDGTWTDFGETTTNSVGQFSYTFTPTAAGAYRLVARFEGNDEYYWSSAETAAVQVNAATTTVQQGATWPQLSAVILITIVAVIIAVAIVGVLVSWTITRALKKRPP